MLLAAVAVVGQVAAAAWAATYSGVTINAITARQARIPDRLQGRVNTTARLLGRGVGWPLGAAAGGVLADAVGMRVAYLAIASGLAVLAIVIWLSPLRDVAARPGRATQMTGIDTTIPFDLWVLDSLSQRP